MDIQNMATFHLFPKLPKELREMIWHHALEEAHKKGYLALDFYWHGRTVKWSPAPRATPPPDHLPSTPAARNALTDLLLSCKEASGYADHLLRKQQRLLFPEIGPDGDDAELYKLVTTVNLEFARVYVRDAVWQWWLASTRPESPVMPPFLQHVRHPLFDEPTQDTISLPPSPPWIHLFHDILATQKWPCRTDREIIRQAFLFFARSRTNLGAEEDGA
jgi:hypothetical protein